MFHFKKVKLSGIVAEKELRIMIDIEFEVSVPQELLNKCKTSLY